MFPGNRLFVNELRPKSEAKLQLVHLPCLYQEVASGQGVGDLVQENPEPAWLLGLSGCTTIPGALRAEEPTTFARAGSVQGKAVFHSPNRACDALCRSRRGGSGPGIGATGARARAGAARGAVADRLRPDARRRPRGGASGAAGGGAASRGRRRAGTSELSRQTSRTGPGGQARQVCPACRADNSEPPCRRERAFARPSLEALPAHRRGPAQPTSRRVPGTLTEGASGRCDGPSATAAGGPPKSSRRASGDACRESRGLVEPVSHAALRRLRTGLDRLLREGLSDPPKLSPPVALDAVAKRSPGPSHQADRRACRSPSRDASMGASRRDRRLAEAALRDDPEAVPEGPRSCRLCDTSKRLSRGTPESPFEALGAEPSGPRAGPPRHRRRGRSRRPSPGVRRGPD
jgi:hypothetical protein